MHKTLRANLTHAYHIIAHWGLDDSTYAHISARTDENHFLILPFGHLFEEVTPESLLLTNLQGEVISGLEYQYNQTGYAIHGSIYKERPDINAIFHLHTHASIAVASSPNGLLPISQWALHFYNQIAYEDYNSLILETKTQGKSLAKQLGNHKVMLQRNHGILTCGSTLHEALFYVHHLEQACKVQAYSIPPKEGWVLPDHDTCLKAREDLLNFETNLGKRDWDAYVRQLTRKKHLKTLPQNLTWA